MGFGALTLPILQISIDLAGRFTTMYKLCTMFGRLLGWYTIHCVS